METLEDQLEYDFSQGCAFKDELVPEAVRYFTGEAMADFDDGEGIFILHFYLLTALSFIYVNLY